MEWINIEDELPEIGERVIVWQRQALEAVRYEGSKFNRFGRDLTCVTHWMSLPTSPLKKEVL
tara:strand:- start:1663 stop:1848 length:186 start_codon:yes stop_codon:yes gene_type:complete